MLWEHKTIVLCVVMVYITSLVAGKFTVEKIFYFLFFIIYSCNTLN